MDSTPTPKDVSEETCSHDWKMEPAWKLVSHGYCLKCEAVTSVLNNPEPDPPVKRRSLRRRKRGKGRDETNDVTPSEGCASNG